MIEFERVQLHNFGSWKSLDFPLRGQGVVRISGATGSGKSTIFRGLFWSLFGYTPEGHRVGDLCRYGTTSCAVRVAFRRHHGGTVTRHAVTRFRNHPVWGNKVRIKSTHVPRVDPDSLRKESDPEIIRLLGIDPELFGKVFYFVQRDSLRFTALSDSARKTFLESLTYGDLLQRYERTARSRSRELRQQLERLEERRQAWSDTLTLLHNQDASAQARVHAEFERLRGLHGAARAALCTVEATYPAARRDAWYTRLPQVETQLRFYERSIAALAAREGPCPVCATALSPEQRQERHQTLQHALQEGRQEHAKLDARMRRYERAQQQVEVLESAISRLKKAQQQPPDTAETTATLEARLRSDTAERLDIVERLAYNDYWVRGFGPMGLRAYCLRHVVVQLNTALRGFLAMIALDVATEIVVQDNRVLFVHAQGRSLASLSGGERQAFDLAMGLSLRSVLETSTTLVDSLLLDEPFEGLDVGLQASCHRVLHALDKGSVFLVTHTDYVAPFAREYQVRKVAGVSQLVNLTASAQKGA